MVTNTETAEKRTAVEYLEFGVKTAKRVTWESWSFRIVGPHQVEVCNESYGYLKDDHSYTVGVAVRDSVAVPAECDCPADLHREPDCKHKAALATVGGPTVLNAAVEFEKPAGDTARGFSSPPTASENTETMAEKLKPDGGEPKACSNGNPHCDGPNSEGLPCFACFEGDCRSQTG